MNQIKSFAFEVKASAADGSTFEGMASVYNVLDGYNEIVAPGAFSKSLKRYMEKPILRFMHSTPVGLATRTVEMADGLMIAGKISNTTVGADCRTLLADRVIGSLSIGFSTVSSMRLDGEESVKKYWADAGYQPSAQELRRIKWGARVLTEIDLYEVSLVDIPANGECDVTSVKAALSGRFTAADLLSSARLELGEIKAGRVLSKANLDRLSTHAAALETCANDLKAMIAQHTPKKGDPDDEVEPEGDSSGEIDVKALRAELDWLSL